jgi:hypothetical protein
VQQKCSQRAAPLPPSRCVSTRKVDAPSENNTDSTTCSLRRPQQHRCFQLSKDAGRQGTSLANHRCTLAPIALTRADSLSESPLFTPGVPCAAGPAHTHTIEASTFCNRGLCLFRAGADAAIVCNPCAMASTPSHNGPAVW